MKTILFLSFLFYSLSALSLPTKFDSKGINYVVIDNTAEPFQIDEKGNKQIGLITEIFEEVIKEVYGNINYSKVSAPFLRALKIMRENNYLKWVSYGSPVWKEPQSTHLSKEPLFKVNHKLVTRKGFRFNSIEDLFGKRVVLINGFSYPGLSKYIRNKKIEVLIVNSHLSALKALEIKRADAFPEIKIRAKYHLKKNKMDFKKFAFHNFNKYIRDYTLHFSFSKEMLPEIHKFDKALVKLRNEKFIKNTILKYLH